MNTPMQFVSDSVHFVQSALADLVDVRDRSIGLSTNWFWLDLPAVRRPMPTQAEQAMDLDYVLANVPAASTARSKGSIA